MSVEIKELKIFNMLLLILRIADTYELLRCYAALVQARLVCGFSTLVSKNAASRFHDAAHHSPLNMISFL